MNYQKHFDDICRAIANVAAPPRPAAVAFSAGGKTSWFGGPNDTRVAADQGLGFLYKYDDAPPLFLSKQPPGTTGLARRLNPDVFYVACRWDYDRTPKKMLADKTIQALVMHGGKRFKAWPADWGPHSSTARVADLSPGLMAALGFKP